MPHLDQIYRRTLLIFQQAGGRPLSALFLAQKLNVTPAHAEDILDNLVRDSVLEYDFDQSSGVHYKPGSAYPYETLGAHPPQYDATAHPPARAATPGASARAAAAPFGAHAGYDGAVGAALAPRVYTSAARGRRAAQTTSRRPSPRRGHDDLAGAYALPPQDPWTPIGPDGCDGSLGPVSMSPPPAAQGAFAAPLPRHTPQPHRARSQAAAPHYYQDFQTPGAYAGGPLVRQSPGQLTAPKTRKAEPFLAGLLSLCVAGGGQLYNGQISKGIAFFVSFLILWAFALGWIVQIWAAVDAYQTAASQREPT